MKNAPNPDEPLTDEEWEALGPAMRSYELPEEAQDAINGALKSRGRPPLENPKQQITLRLDADIVDEFRSMGKGWQTEINTVLKEWVENRTS